MNTILDKRIVLVLNRNWQSIDIKTPQSAFGMMSCGAARGLDIHREILAGEDSPEFKIQPVAWEQWTGLPVREGDCYVLTTRGKIRVPTVIVVHDFGGIPMTRPRFSLRAVWQRDGGICQYTGKPLTPSEGSIDHVIPRARGGRTTWENCVLADRKINNRKADKTPAEAGLALKKKPVAPKALPVTVTLQNTQGISDWEIFLGS